MIVRPHPTALQLLFSCSGSIVPAILPMISVAALLGCLAAWLRVERSGSQLDELTRFDFTPFTAVGVAISLFLGFRNNASYERWWEGRKQWGAQLIAVRNFARLLSALKVSADERRAMVRLTVAHSHATRVQLRAMWAIGSGRSQQHQLEEGDDAVAQRDSFIEPAERASLVGRVNPADAILGMLSARLGKLHRGTSSVSGSHGMPRAAASPPQPAAAVGAAAAADSRDCRRAEDAGSGAEEDASRALSGASPSSSIPEHAPSMPASGGTHGSLQHDVVAADGISQRQGQGGGAEGGGESERLDSISVAAASQLLDVLGGVQGACERIASTPLPFAYVLLVHRTASAWVVLAPFAMAGHMGWWTPVFNALVAYTFFGLDELARQLENPFGTEPHCLALDAVCRTIEIAAAEAIGDQPPPALKPDAGYTLM